MKVLYDKTALECSKIITEHYSTSFTLGIKTLDKKFHFPIYAIYGFVRYADEIVDTFHDYDRATLLAEFKAEAYKAIEQKISMNPVLHAFQMVVHEYSIEMKLIDAFLHSMEMDLQKIEYTHQKYNEYIYGSAEVVGLMCLRVFCEGDNAEFERLQGAARSLGAAFQKVNFLRDMQSDFGDRGRVYFPNVHYQHFNKEAKLLIEKDIQKDFDDAHEGIRQLPKSARLGVYLAYIYYLNLFDKIKETPIQDLLENRIRIPNIKKMLLLVKSYFRFQLQIL